MKSLVYTDKYWKRKSRKKSPFQARALFHLSFMGTLLSICLVNYLVLFWLAGELLSLPIYLVGPAYLVSAYLGGKLLLSSKKPWLSYAGTLLVGAPLGLVGYSLSGGSLELFLMQVLLTSSISIVLLGLMQVLSSGIKLPDWLFIAGSLASAVFFNVMFTNELINAPVMNWITVLFVHIRLGHVWGKARQITVSVDNGIDGVGVLILESLNPFYWVDAFKRIEKAK